MTLGAAGTYSLGENALVSAGWSQRRYIKNLAGYDDPTRTNHYLNADASLRFSQNRYGGGVSVQLRPQERLLPPAPVPGLLQRPVLRGDGRVPDVQLRRLQLRQRLQADRPAGPPFQHFDLAGGHRVVFAAVRRHEPDRRSTGRREGRSRMVKVLVTGGAGFIGSNFVRYALRAHPDWHVTTLDKLTYCGRLENLHDVIDNPRHTFVHGDIADSAVSAPLVRGVAHRGALRGRDARRSLAAERRRVHPHRRLRHLRAARSRAPGHRAAPVRPDFDRRGLRSRCPTGALEGDRRTAAAQPVLGQQGRRRPARLQLLGDLPGAGGRHARLEQLRPVPVPREGHPALHHERAGGPARCRCTATA